MSIERGWPRSLWIVRHGQSAGNVARDAAVEANLPVIDIALRDMDVPLSRLGEQQADALGQWYGRLRADERPSVVLASPYVRARDTATRLLGTAGIDRDAICFRLDERLREKEYGVLDRLTRTGIQKRFPDEATRFDRLGKFYYRPPGGESWTDVILRLRGVVHDLRNEYSAERVLIVAHQVVVHCLRYLVENLSEEQVLTIDRGGDLANCSVTHYERVHGDVHRPPALRLFNFVAPLEESGTPVTANPDARIAPR